MVEPSPESLPPREITGASRVTKRFFGYFLRGLVFLAPVVITLYIVVAVFRAVDGWLGLPIPGSGFVATVLLVTLFGFFASGFLTRSFVLWLDEIMERLPFVRLLYSSIRDFVNAFVGEKRRFDKPVIVKLFENSSAHALGFVTQETLQAMENVRAVAGRHGATMADLVRCTVFLADLADWAAFNEVYRSYFTGNFPARSAIAASGAPSASASRNAPHCGQSRS